MRLETQNWMVLFPATGHINMFYCWEILVFFAFSGEYMFLLEYLFASVIDHRLFIPLLVLYIYTCIYVCVCVCVCVIYKKYNIYIYNINIRDIRERLFGYMLKECIRRRWMQIIGRCHWWFLYLRMLWKGLLLLKTTALLVFFMWLVKS